MDNVRSPAAAGRFYAGAESELRSQIEGCFADEHGPGEVPEVREGPRRILGLVSPHAGYPYSGPVAAHGFSAAAEDGEPESVIILGPNHSGQGSAVAIAPSDAWKTPLGRVELNGNLRHRVNENSETAEMDPVAHESEHSLEVQLPFLQYLFGNGFEIVPICLRRQDLPTSEDLGKAIGEAASGENVLVIASTDLTHYEPPDSARSKDEKAMEKMRAMDWKGLTNLVTSGDYSVCGYGPVSSAILASKRLGAESSELFKYATSGDTAGPSAKVVGYCSLGFLK